MASGRRTRDIKLVQNLDSLIEELDNLTLGLDSYHLTDTTEYANDPLAIRQFSRELKSRTNEFASLCSIVHKRLKNHGRAHDAERVRLKRVRRVHQTEQVLETLKGYLLDLGEESISSLDVRSVSSAGTRLSRKSDLNLSRVPLGLDHPDRNLLGPGDFGSGGSDQSSIRGESTARYVTNQTINPYREVADPQKTVLVEEQEEPVPYFSVNNIQQNTTLAPQPKSDMVGGVPMELRNAHISIQMEAVSDGYSETQSFETSAMFSQHAQDSTVDRLGGNGMGSTFTTDALHKPVFGGTQFAPTQQYAQQLDASYGNGPYNISKQGDSYQHQVSNTSVCNLQPPSMGTESFGGEGVPLIAAKNDGLSIPVQAPAGVQHSQNQSSNTGGYDGENTSVYAVHSNPITGSRNLGGNHQAFDQNRVDLSNKIAGICHTGSPSRSTSKQGFPLQHQANISLHSMQRRPKPVKKRYTQFCQSSTHQNIPQQSIETMGTIYNPSSPNMVPVFVPPLGITNTIRSSDFQNHQPGVNFPPDSSTSACHPNRTGDNKKISSTFKPNTANARHAIVHRDGNTMRMQNQHCGVNISAVPSVYAVSTRFPGSNGITASNSNASNINTRPTSVHQQAPTNNVQNSYSSRGVHFSSGSYPPKAVHTQVGNNVPNFNISGQTLQYQQNIDYVSDEINQMSFNRSPGQELGGNEHLPYSQQSVQGQEHFLDESHLLDSTSYVTSRPSFLSQNTGPTSQHSMNLGRKQRHQFPPDPRLSSAGHHETSRREPHAPFFLRPSAAPFQPANMTLNDESILSPLQVMSNHLLEESLVSKSIPKFDGTAHKFWPWAGKIEAYISSLNIQNKPGKILQILEAYSTGEPYQMLSNSSAAVGFVTAEDLAEIWDRLVFLFASSEAIAEELLQLMEDSPVVSAHNTGKDISKLYDLCKIIEYNMNWCQDLDVMNISTGLRTLRSKLPANIQLQWGKSAIQFENQHGFRPGFKEFTNFLNATVKLRLNPSYKPVFPDTKKKQSSTKISTKTLKTDLVIDNLQNPKPKDNKKSTKAANKSSQPTSKQSNHDESSIKPKHKCIYHENATGHSIRWCRAFRTLSHHEKMQFVEKHRDQLCGICLSDHQTAKCDADVTCYKCERKHHTYLHKPDNSPSEIVSVKCTNVCSSMVSKNCSKTVLADLTMSGVPNKTLRSYIILDEQSNTSLVDERVLHYFGLEFPKQEYTMKFASQDCELSLLGQVVTGLSVKGVKCGEVIEVPKALSCPNIADTTTEVASPEIVANIPSISQYAEHFPEFSPQTDVLLLLGRDCGRAMFTECLTTSEPYLHRTPLGWCLVGNVCPEIDPSLRFNEVSVKKTATVPSHESMEIKYNFSNKPRESPSLRTFDKYADDDTPGISAEDRMFMSMMETNITITDSGHIELPLPLKHDNFPDNRAAVFVRTSKTLEKLKSQPLKLEACLLSMQKSIEAGFVEQVSSLSRPSSKSWYLPVFCVEQVKKSKCRLVYDASARFKGTSLNDCLLQGPDLNNQLRSVLLRFREKPVAFGADIESMFSNFKVPESQRDLLRYFWFKDNQPDSELVEYRSSSHIFGCTSSPAVANCALKYCASQVIGDDNHLLRQYLDCQFYVDDGLFSVNSEEEAVNVLSNSICLLQRFNVRLHKIFSNSQKVLDCFPESERATVTQLPSDKDVHCSTLGVSWDTVTDQFVMNSAVPHRPFTKRGLLSAVHSLYDPIGMSAPVVLQAKLIQREILLDNDLKDFSWDDQLPQRYYNKWNDWLASLPHLVNFRVDRCFHPQNFDPIRQEIHIFADSSEMALGVVSYMRSINAAGEIHVNFIQSQSKLCPKGATSMPRLELCAALEAAKCARTIFGDLLHKPDEVYLYSDSMIALGYITNQSRKFTKYVQRRTEIIQDLSDIKKWYYVSTDSNPADMASRPTRPDELLQTPWFSGPGFLWDKDFQPSPPYEANIEALPEEKVSVLVSLKELSPSTSSALSGLFQRISSFSKLVNVTKYVLMFIQKKTKAPVVPDETLRETAIKSLLKCAQKEHIHPTIKVLEKGRNLPENCKLAQLSPFVDNDGIVRVGGRLKNANLPFSIKHPYLIPGKHPLAKVVALHFHKENKHQGTHISHNSIIQNGFFIEEGRQVVRNLINNCITCKKLRGATAEQQMADLPTERLEEAPPFSHVGLDVFGPFYIHEGKSTRRSSSTKKMWAVIFVCLPSRAIHLEPLYSMDANSFRSALTRFTSIRGTCRSINSDQGGNFISVSKQLSREMLDLQKVSSELAIHGISWKFSPAYASHHNGAIERKISSVRRVLESSMLLMSNRQLSREEFITFLAEAMSVVNNTPLWTVPNSPNDPVPLTPSMLLTLKSEPNPPPLDTYTEADVLAYGPRRYRRVQYLADQFWKRWRTEYLHTLTARHKWKTRKPCVSVGDVVLVRDKQVPRNHWPLGRIEGVKHSKDGLVRTVSIRQAPLPNSVKPRFKDRSIADVVLLVKSPNHACD